MADTISALVVDQMTDSDLSRLARKLQPHLAQIVAEVPASTEPPRWLDTRQAALHLGMHRDTLNRLAAEGRVPSEQQAPGCKRWFRVADLDAWRTT